jgi:hypothetical protein
MMNKKTVNVSPNWNKLRDNTPTKAFEKSEHCILQGIELHATAKGPLLIDTITPEP